MKDYNFYLIWDKGIYFLRGVPLTGRALAASPLSAEDKFTWIMPNVADNLSEIFGEENRPFSGLIK